MYRNGAMSDYDFDMFEPHNTVSNAAVAPKKKTTAAPVNKPVLKVVEKQDVKRKSADNKHTGLRSAFIVVLAVFVLAVLGLQVSVGAKSYELSQQIEAVEKKISEAETENVRLTNALNSFTTIEKIDDYAVNVLGMTKSESYQIKCIDLSEGDKVLYCEKSMGILDIINKGK